MVSVLTFLRHSVLRQLCECDSEMFQSVNVLEYYYRGRVGCIRRWMVSL